MVSIQLLNTRVGDIGYQPDIVEKNLDRLFYLAHRWGCVLLLDEADVFLAKRSKEDIKRNGLVSSKQFFQSESYVRVGPS